MSVNKVILVGRVGKDAELVGNENKVARFTVATSERYTNKDGEKVENTEWHNVVVFGKSAEMRAKWITKGKQLYVEGKIQTQEYEKDGQKRYATQIVANNITFLSTAKAEEKERELTEELPEDNNDLPF